MLDAIPAPAAVKHARRRCQFVNAVYCEWIGLPRESVFGHCDAELFAGQDVRQLAVLDDRVLGTGVREQYARAHVADGRMRYMTVSKCRLRVADNEPLVLLTMLETREEHDQREAVAGQRDFLETVLDALSFPISVKDDSHLWIHLNRAALAEHGWTRDLVMCMREFDVHPPAIAERNTAEDDHALATGEMVVAEDRNQLPDAREHWYLETKQVTALSSVERLLVVSKLDITERKHVVLEADDSRCFLEVVVGSLPLPLVVKDEKHQFVMQRKRLVTLPNGQRVLVGTSVDITGRRLAEERPHEIARHVRGMIYQYRARADGRSYSPFAIEGISSVPDPQMIWTTRPWCFAFFIPRTLRPPASRSASRGRSSSRGGTSTAWSGTIDGSSGSRVTPSRAGSPTVRRCGTATSLADLG